MPSKEGLIKEILKTHSESKVKPKHIKRSPKELVLLKLDMIECKGGKCRKCGYNKYYGALTFHHIDPSKKRYEWKQMKYLHRKLIRKELDKCILLCSNCHAELHGKIYNGD